MAIIKTLLILQNTLIQKKKVCFIEKNSYNKKLLEVFISLGMLTFDNNTVKYKVVISNSCLKNNVRFKIELKKSKKKN